MDEPIDSTTSKRLCDDLNENHKALIIGMAKTTLPKHIPNSFMTTIQNVKVESITSKGCSLSFVVCQGLQCEMYTKFYRFHTPLTSADVAKDLTAEKLVTGYKDVVYSPNWNWLLMKPLALSILIIEILSGIGTYGLGIDGMTNFFTKANSDDNDVTAMIQDGISMIFGSPMNFAYVIQFLWYGTTFSHFVEALIAFYHCIMTLQLNVSTSINWFLLVWTVGYPIYSEFNALHQLHLKNNANSKKNE